MKENKDRIIIASDVNGRDGIGVEIYRNDELLWKFSETTQKEPEQSEFLRETFLLN